MDIDNEIKELEYQIKEIENGSLSKLKNKLHDKILIKKTHNFIRLFKEKINNNLLSNQMLIQLLDDVKVTCYEIQKMDYLRKISIGIDFGVFSLGSWFDGDNEGTGFYTYTIDREEAITESENTIDYIKEINNCNNYEITTDMDVDLKTYIEVISEIYKNIKVNFTYDVTLDEFIKFVTISFSLMNAYDLRK